MHEYKRMNIGTSLIKRTSDYKTALSTLPVYKGTGKRAIYFCGGTNQIMSANDLTLPTRRDEFSVFHYGYPHLSPKLQGDNLRDLFQTFYPTMITGLDVNGADDQVNVIESTLPLVDFLHSNIEEALSLSGELDSVLARIDKHHNMIIEDEITFEEVERCTSRFLAMGCTIVAITLGHRGCFVKVTENVEKVDRLNKMLLNKAQGITPGATLRAPAYDLIRSSSISNTTGAGDSFVGGFLACFATLASPSTMTLSLADIVKVAQMAAVYRLSGIDTPITISSLL
jgi:sugar/nucleoside kinase (ribokinase family)